MATANSGVPYNLPYPVASETPDVPRDIQALALKVHSSLADIDKRITTVETSVTNNATEVANLNTTLRPPNSVTEDVVTAATGFSIVSQRMWRWGLMVAVDLVIETKADIEGSSGGNITNVTMATWKTTVKPVGNFPLYSMVSGLMAGAYMNPTIVRLATLEAGQKWGKNTSMEFGGLYMTAVART